MRHPLIDSWYDHARDLLPPGAEVWDAHTHTGQDDPDGFTNTADELLSSLTAAGHQAAVVTSSADPSGYVTANDRVLAETARSSDRLIPFLRVDPRTDDAVEEVRRSLDAGHRGIKLHPRSEEFDLDHPRLDGIAELASQRAAPILIHAGRGMAPLGTGPVRLIDRHPGLTVILAHCGISDLSELAPEAGSRPGLLFDTAWWSAADLAALLTWVDAGQILYASDTPYGDPRMSSTITLRAAVQAGVSGAALTAIMGGNLQRALEGEPATTFGSGVAAHPEPTLLRVAASLFGAIECVLAGLDRAQPMELALRAAASPVHGALMAAVRRTIEAAIEVEDRRERLGLLVVACSAVLTPAAGSPEI